MGQFEARWNNQRLDLRSRHAQSLMAYLALTAGAQHRREKLAGMFWPDVDDAAARQNLRCVLWRINRTLAEAAETRILSAAQFIFADGRLEVGWLREAPFQVDVDVLLRCQPGRATVSELMQAARACAGEFLPGFYDEWVSEYREQIAASFHQVMDALTRRLMADQRWQEAATWANFWISRAREAEEAYRVLMQAQAATRDLGGAAQTYAARHHRAAPQKARGRRPRPQRPDERDARPGARSAPPRRRARQTRRWRIHPPHHAAD
jgi:DNA-binding SARP family transcriptional activator